jgi:hypothetical protein
MHSVFTFRWVTTREITPAECSWLKESIPAGTMLQTASDPYGVCSSNGQMVNFENGEYPFELPLVALLPIDEDATARS